MHLRAALLLPLGSGLLFVVAGCASDEAVRPAAAADPKTTRWSPSYDVRETFVPWEKLPRASAEVAALSLSPPAARKSPAPKSTAPGRAAAKSTASSHRDVGIRIPVPSAPGCELVYQEAERAQDDTGIYPAFAAGLSFVCDDEAFALAHAECRDGHVASGERSAHESQRVPSQVSSPLETFVLVERGWVSPRLLSAAARAGGVDPRAFLLEAAKRSPRPACLSQLAERPLIEAFVREAINAMVIHPDEETLDLDREAVKQALGQPGVSDEEREALQERLVALERRRAQLRQAYQPSPEVLARKQRHVEVADALQDALLQLLKENKRPPSWEELRERLRDDEDLKARLATWPRGEPVPALLRAWWETALPRFSPYVRAHLDGEPGYDLIRAPTALAEGPAHKADQPPQGWCGRCSDSAGCDGGLVCSTDLYGGQEGTCVAFSSGWVPEKARGTCARGDGSVGERLPMWEGVFPFTRGVVCEEPPSCDAVLAAREGKKCEDGEPASTVDEAWAADRFGFKCGPGGACIDEIDACGVRCGENGACPEGLACEVLRLSPAGYDPAEQPELRGAACIAPGVDRRDFWVVDEERSRKEDADDPGWLQRRAAGIWNRAVGGLGETGPEGPFRTRAVYGGVSGGPLRFFRLDERSECVVVASEKRAKDDDIESSAPPVFYDRRVHAAVTCDGRTFLPLFAQVCRTGPVLSEDSDPSALQPIFVQARDLRYAGLHAIATTYAESLLSARRRVVHQSYDPTCFWPAGEDLASMVRAIQGTAAGGNGDGARASWGRYPGWPDDERLWAVFSGEPVPDASIERGPDFLGPGDLDELEGGLRKRYEALFAEREAVLAFAQAVREGRPAAFTGELERDAARAAIVLWFSRSLLDDAPFKVPGDRSAPLQARERAWLALEDVKTSLDVLERWAETLEEEDRIRVRFAVETAAASFSEEELAYIGISHAIEGRFGYVPRGNVDAVALSPLDVICDLGRRWAPDSERTWRLFEKSQPHWYFRTSWADLRSTALTLGRPLEGEGAAICHEHFSVRLQPLSDEEEERFAHLEVRRLTEDKLARDEVIELGQLGSRFAWTAADPEHARDRLLEKRGQGGAVSLASCRNLQIEAKTHLKALYVAEESHRGEFDLYVKDFGKLGFRSFAEDPHYAIEVLEADDRHFRGRAVGNKGLVQGDVWEITDSNELVNTHDACAR